MWISAWTRLTEVSLTGQVAVLAAPDDHALLRAGGNSRRRRARGSSRVGSAARGWSGSGAREWSRSCSTNPAAPRPRRELQAVVAELQQVAVLQRLLARDARAVDEATVVALQIPDDPRPTPFWRSTAWLREMFLSVSRTVFATSRPTEYSSRARSTTVWLAWSSSIESFHIRRSDPAVIPRRGQDASQNNSKFSCGRACAPLRVDR